MERLNCAFFVDFDGTISTADVCDELVKSFCQTGWREINERWLRREISTLECAEQTFSLFRTQSREDFLKLLDTIEIDPAFPAFVDFCREQRYPLTILSDGYDFYIEHLLKREGYEIAYYANKLCFAEGLRLQTPFASADCGLCGTCKTELLRKLRGSAQKTIYIGDGSSDFCPAEHADIVFAKEALYEHCLKIGKEARLITGFHDVLRYLRRMKEEGRL